MAALWSSTDGATWKRIVDSEGTLAGVDDVIATAVAADDSGYLVTGEARGPDTTSLLVWESLDAVTWSAVSSEHFDTGGRLHVAAVAAGNPAIMAGFEATSTFQDHRGAIWMRHQESP